MLALDDLDGARAIGRFEHDVLALLEEHAKHLARVGLILDDHDPPRVVLAHRAIDAAANRVALDRQLHHEAAAAVGTIAKRFDRTAMQLDDAARERQSNAESTARAIDALLRLDEQVEDLSDHARLDSD